MRYILYILLFFLLLHPRLSQESFLRNTKFQLHKLVVNHCIVNNLTQTTQSTNSCEVRGVKISAFNNRTIRDLDASTNFLMHNDNKAVEWRMEWWNSATKVSNKGSKVTLGLGGTENSFPYSEQRALFLRFYYHIQTDFLCGNIVGVTREGELRGSRKWEARNLWRKFECDERGLGNRTSFFEIFGSGNYLLIKGFRVFWFQKRIVLKPWNRPISWTFGALSQQIPGS